MELESDYEDEDDDDGFGGDLIYARLVSNLIHVHNLIKRMAMYLQLFEDIPGMSCQATTLRTPCCSVRTTLHGIDL